MVIPPSAGQALTASYEFDCEVRFDTDRLPIQRIAPNVYAWESIKLWEERPSQPTGAGDTALSIIADADYISRWEVTIPGVTV